MRDAFLGAVCGAIGAFAASAAFYWHLAKPMRRSRRFDPETQVILEDRSDDFGWR